MFFQMLPVAALATLFLASSLRAEPPERDSRSKKILIVAEPHATLERIVDEIRTTLVAVMLLEVKMNRRLFTDDVLRAKQKELEALRTRLDDLQTKAANWQQVGDSLTPQEKKYPAS